MIDRGAIQGDWEVLAMAVLPSPYLEAAAAFNHRALRPNTILRTAAAGTRSLMSLRDIKAKRIHHFRQGRGMSNE